MKKLTKTKAVKAVKYWAAPDSINLYRSRKEASYYSGFYAPKVKPVALLPMDAASVRAMVEEIGMTIAAMSGTNALDEDVARAALAAIGIEGYCK